MSPTTPVAKFTYDDYLLFPDDGKRYELIEGERFVTPARRTKHQRITTTLVTMLNSFVHENHTGEVFVAPTDVILSEVDVVQPDLLFIEQTRTSIITEKNIQGAPDLVVEIVSEATRRTDEIIKRKLYEQYGVQEYWVIDHEVETVKAYRRSGQGFGTPIEFTIESQDQLTSPLFPGWKLVLQDLFQ